MKIGVMTPATVEAGDIAAIAREAEQLGYESLFIPEHPVIPIGFKTVPPGGGTLPEHYGRWMDPFISLAVAAAVTQRIKLGTGICLLPEREPLVTAKAIATLDIVSSGRVVLGVGAGWLREETEATGAQFGTRWKRLRETVEALRLLWTEPEPSYRGEIVHFDALRCDPKPVQKGGPPILLGAHGPKGRERVVRSYDGWCPVAGKPADFKREAGELRALAKERGRNPESLQIMAFVGPHEDGLSLHEDGLSLHEDGLSLHEDGLSLDDLKVFEDAGASRLVLFSQRDAIKMANGQALEVIRRIAPTVERATHL